MTNVYVLLWILNIETKFLLSALLEETKDEKTELMMNFELLYLRCRPNDNCPWQLFWAVKITSEIRNK